MINDNQLSTLLSVAVLEDSGESYYSLLLLCEQTKLEMSNNLIMYPEEIIPFEALFSHSFENRLNKIYTTNEINVINKQKQSSSTAKYLLWLQFKSTWIGRSLLNMPDSMRVVFSVTSYKRTVPSREEATILSSRSISRPVIAYINHSTIESKQNRKALPMKVLFQTEFDINQYIHLLSHTPIECLFSRCLVE